MAGNLLWMTPGCELHLLHGGASQPVRILALDAHPRADVAATATYTRFDASVVTIANGTFTPGNVGYTFALVTFNENVNGTTVAHTGFVRVHVHNTVTRLFLANRHITLRAGAADYIPTVFAEFDDHTIADVTGHAWVSVQAGPNAPFTITAGDALGRLHATGVAGDHGTVIATAGHLTASAQVTIAPAANTERRIATPMRYHGERKVNDRTIRRNILFLPEGFPDEDLFHKHVLKIVDIMFSSSAFSPYPQLADRINVWSAFEPPPAGVTLEAGITIGALVNDRGEQYPSDSFTDQDHYSAADLTALMGLPVSGSPATVDKAKQDWTGVPSFVPDKLEDPNFSAWRRQQNLVPLVPKDSLFGFIYGGRTCGPLAPPLQPPSTNVPNLNASWELLNPVVNLSLSSDPRRVAEDPGFVGHYNPNFVSAANTMFQGYLESMKYGIDPNDPDYDIGRTWMSGGTDEGLIALLVFDELTGGTQMSTMTNGVETRVGIAVALGNARAATLVPNATPADHTVGLAHPVYDQIATTLAHELAHALGLGDEYEFIQGGGGRDAVNEAPANFERSSNLMHVSNIIDGHGKVIGPNVKWNWHRILLASVITDVTPPPPGSQTPATVQLEYGQGLKWKLARDKNLDVYVRLRAINSRATNAQIPAPLGPFKITDITGDTLVLNGPLIVVSQYVAGSVLFLPSMNGTTPRTLVHPAVLQYLTTKGPFGVTSDHSIATTSGESAAKNIPNFSKPKNRESVIGVYDGAGVFNTGVFRPAGNCRMRITDVQEDTELGFALHFIPYPKTVRRARGFCFVCKYILINEIWPGAFDLLDREYPEDC